MTEIPANAPAPAAGEFRVGLVFSRSWTVLSRNVGKFLALTAITVLPDLLILIPGLRDGTAARAAAANINPGAILAGGVTALVWGILIVITHATVLYGAFQVMRGQSFQVGDSLQKGLSRFFAVIGTSICMVVAMGLSAILLVVPFFILLSMFYVALPACVVERLGPFQSLSRSGRLTKGHRWKILGIWLILAIVSGVVNNIIGRILIAAGIAITLLVSMVWHALMSAYQAITVAVAYHDLRVAKEGVDIEHIASVFD
jgi:hypothetical protein